MDYRPRAAGCQEFGGQPDGPWGGLWFVACISCLVLVERVQVAEFLKFD